MRRLFTSSLIFFVSASLPYTVSAQIVSTAYDGSLVGAREFGIFATGRILSKEYSVADARTALGLPLLSRRISKARSPSRADSR